MAEPYIREIINDNDDIKYKKCNNHDVFKLFKDISVIICKILLNNYSKNTNSDDDDDDDNSHSIRKIKKLSSKSMQCHKK